MSRKRHLRSLGLLVLIAILLGGALPLQAAPPSPGPRWLSFDGTAPPVPPTLSLLAADADEIRLTANLPGGSAEEVGTKIGPFTRLSGQGYGYPAEVGRPELPVLRRDVEIPFGAEVTLEVVSATYRDYTLAELGLQPIYPLQPLRPKTPGVENRPLHIDRAFYAAGAAVTVHPAQETYELYLPLVIRTMHPPSPETAALAGYYSAEVLLPSPEMLALLVASGVEIDNLRTLDPDALFPRPEGSFVPLVATVYLDAAAAAQLAAQGLETHPIPPDPEACSGWPTYNALVTRMQNLANTYPDIVRMTSIGQSVQGRELWVLKITDNPDDDEDEPEFRYIGTMHGNEGVGTEMILRLAELLTSNYGSDPYYTMLVDEIEIWLLPTYNPDGYESCTRRNANSVDLNRNLPDRFTDPHNSPIGRQPETQAVMYWTYDRYFVLGANYHTGALVFNIPWDAVAAPGQPVVPAYVPDDDIFMEFGLGYTVRNPMIWNGGWPNGITRGWEWYQIYGGLQDWAYHWEYEQHVTIEISNYQPGSYSQMGTYWDANRDAMLWWMERVLTGARGIVTDFCTGAPLAATVDVVEIGKPVRTDPAVGNYHRLLLPGTYTLVASAPGYPTESATVTVGEGPATVQHFALGEGNTHTVQGTVTDLASGAPLAATVELVGTPIVTQTNPANGHYALQLCPGPYLFRVSAPQHQTEERAVVVAGDRVEDFALAGYNVAAGASARAGAPGETVTHTLVITNIGGLTDTYNLSLEAGAWPAALLTPQVGPLAPGETGQAQVAVVIPTAPLTSTVLFSDVFGLEVTSLAVPEVGAQTAGTTYALADLAVALGALEDSLGGPAGHPLTYTLRLTNTGSYTDSYTLAAQGNAWSTTVQPPLVSALGPGASAEVLVRVEIPTAPAAPTDTVTIRAASGWDDDIRAEQILHSSVLGTAVAAGDSQALGAPGQTVTHTLVITNVGAITDTYTIAVVPGAWPADLLTSQVSLAPGETGQAQVAVHIPHQPLSATVFLSDTFSLYVTSTVVPEVGTQAIGTTYAAIVLDVALGADRTSGLGRPGQIVTYTLAITNVGTYTDAYTLQVLPGSTWAVTVTPTQSGWLGPGESAGAVLWVTVPAGRGGSSDAASVRVTSGSAMGVYREIDVTTTRAWGFFLALAVK